MTKMGLGNRTLVLHFGLECLQSQLNKTVQEMETAFAPFLGRLSSSVARSFHTRFLQTLPNCPGCRPWAIVSATVPLPVAPSLYRSRGPASRMACFPCARPLASFFISPVVSLTYSPLSTAASSCKMPFYVRSLSGWITCRGSFISLCLRWTLQTPPRDRFLVSVSVAASTPADVGKG